MRKRFALFLLLFPLVPSVLLANKTSVSLAGPASVAAGTEVTVTVQVAHRGNSAMHHTEWVSVATDGREIARWEFSSSTLPESENFTREVKLTVSKPVEVTARGSCNIHGGREAAVLKIGVQ